MMRGERIVCSSNMQPWRPGGGWNVGGGVLLVNVYDESCVRFCKRENTKTGRKTKKNEDRSVNFTNPTHRQRQRDEGGETLEKVQGGNECP